MSGDHPLTLEALARRTDALERQNRRLKHAVIAMAIVMAAGATAQVARGAAPSIVGDKFTLVNPVDRALAVFENRASFGSPARPTLTFLDQDGNPVVRIGIGDKGPTLEVTDRNGRKHDYFGGPIVRPATQ
jgi:hypothetical protein